MGLGKRSRCNWIETSLVLTCTLERNGIKKIIDIWRNLEGAGNEWVLGRSNEPTGGLLSWGWVSWETDANQREPTFVPPPDWTIGGGPGQYWESTEHPIPKIKSQPQDLLQWQKCLRGRLESGSVSGSKYPRPKDILLPSLFHAESQEINPWQQHLLVF